MIARSELLDVVYRHYPRNMHTFARIYVPEGDPYFKDTEEYRRLVEAASRGRAEYGTWKVIMDSLTERYSLQNESLALLSGWQDPAYSARIWIIPKKALSFHVSLLGPYYGIHLPGIPEEEPIARDVVREIEAAYPGYQRVPPEIGNEVIPDVETEDGAEMGEATIYICLFGTPWTFVKP